MGLNSLLPSLPKIDVAIVGEPTLMQLAIAEKGLIVFDGKVEGTASHAAHPNEDNPISKLPKVIRWLENFSFENNEIYITRSGYTGEDGFEISSR